MSSNIANDHLWGDEEVAYQLARGRQSEVIANRQLHGSVGKLEDSPPPEVEKKSGVLELDREVYEFVVHLNIEQLRKHLKKSGVSSSGTEQELRGRLAQILQAKRDDSNRS